MYYLNFLILDMCNYVEIYTKIMAPGINIHTILATYASYKDN